MFSTTNLRNSLLSAAIALIVCFLSATTADAATFTWNNSGGNLNTEADWNPSTGGPPGAGDTGVIPSGFLANMNAVLSNGTPDELQVMTGGILQINLTFAGNNNVVLDGGRFQNSANRNYSGLVFVRSDSFIGGTSAALGLNGVIADHGGGTGKLIKDTAGTVNLGSTANTYTGGTDISAGILGVSVNDATGTGDVNLFSGGRLAHSGNITLTSNIIADGGIISTTANWNMNAPIGLKSDTIISTGAVASTLSGIISDNGGTPGKLFKTGSGRYSLTNILNTFTGGIEVQSGTIRGTTTGSLGSGGVVVKSGAIVELFTTATQTAGVTLESGARAVLFSSSDAITAMDGSIFGLETANRSTTNPIDITGTVTLLEKAGAGVVQGFNGVISGSGKLIHDGSADADNTVLGAANTFLGGLDHIGGILTISGVGRLPDSGIVTVSSGAILDYIGVSESIGGLAGTGNVELGGGTLTVLEGIAPGMSAGTLTIDEGGSLVLDPGSTNVFELGPLAGANDQVVLSGLANLTLGGVLQIDSLNLDIGQYTLFDLNGGTVSGAFSSIQMFGDANILIQGGDVILNVTSNTPEPSSLLLCSLALAGASVRRKRRLRIRQA